MIKFGEAGEFLCILEALKIRRVMLIGWILIIIRLMFLVL